MKKPTINGWLEYRVWDNDMKDYVWTKVRPEAHNVIQGWKWVEPD